MTPAASPMDSDSACLSISSSDMPALAAVAAMEAEAALPDGRLEPQMVHVLSEAEFKNVHASHVHWLSTATVRALEHMVHAVASLELRYVHTAQFHGPAGAVVAAGAGAWVAVGDAIDGAPDEAVGTRGTLSGRGAVAAR